MNRKRSRHFLWFSLACAALLMLTLVVTGYRASVVFSTDWDEVLSQADVWDYFKAAGFLVFLLAMRR